MTANVDSIRLDAPPSQWVKRFAGLIASGGRVLDVACGGGRHARMFAALGYMVDAVDRDVGGFANVPPSVRVLQADLEEGPWPYEGARFAGVVVTNYLHRPLLPTLLDSVAQGGVFIYETFSAGNERFGRPSRPEFLLRRGELLGTVRGQLDVVAYEDVFDDVPKASMVQRIAAVRPAP